MSALSRGLAARGHERPLMPSPERLLILVSDPAVNQAPDFEELATWISELDPATRVFVMTDPSSPALSDLPDLPTLTVSFVPLRHFRPRRGPVLQGQHVSKSAEYRALQRLGIPVPRWVRLLPGRTPDLSELGPYVVTKPDFGARGADDLWSLVASR